MINELKSLVSKALNRRAMRKYRSSMGWREAPKYERFLRKAQRSSVGDLMPIGDAGPNVEQFRKLGATAIWTPEAELIANSIYAKFKAREAAGEDLWSKGGYGAGHDLYKGDFWQDYPEFEALFRGQVGAFLENYFQAHFKIFYCTLHRSIRTAQDRLGAQLWHNDGGPGTCVILGFFPHPTDERSGCTEVLPWEPSLKLFEEAIEKQKELVAAYCREHSLSEGQVTKSIIRVARDSYYSRKIEQEHKSEVIMPTGKAGLTAAFTNNLLHRGGYPADVGGERNIVLVHCYPSDEPTPYSTYRKDGLSKHYANPSGPDF